MSETSLPERKCAAEELRAFAGRFERAADSVYLSRDGRGQERRIALLYCADEARSRARVLDPDDES